MKLCSLYDLKLGRNGEHKLFFIHSLDFISIDTKISNFSMISYTIHFCSYSADSFYACTVMINMSINTEAPLNITISIDNLIHTLFSIHFVLFLIFAHFVGCLGFGVSHKQSDAIESAAAVVQNIRIEVGIRSVVCSLYAKNFSHLIFNSVHGYNRNS